MINPDVNNNDLFMGWVLATFALEDAIRVVPDLEVELMEAFNNEWCDYCAEQNTCPVCGIVSNGDQTIGDHGMCKDCFEHRNDLEEDDYPLFKVTLTLRFLPTGSDDIATYYVRAVEAGSALKIAFERWQSKTQKVIVHWTKLVDSSTEEIKE